MLAAQLDRLYPREGVMAARPFKHKKAQGPEWLRVSRRDQLPDDPIQRFKFRQELVRRAENIAWNQLYAMENELGCRPGVSRPQVPEEPVDQDAEPLRT